MRLSEYTYLNKQMRQTHTTSMSSASRAEAPPAPPITIPRGTPALLVGVASALDVDLGVARVLIMTSRWVVVTGCVVASGLDVARGLGIVASVGVAEGLGIVASVGIAEGLGIVASGLIVARSPGLSVATVRAITSGWVLVAGLAVVGLVVTLGQIVSLVIPELK